MQITKNQALKFVGILKAYGEGKIIQKYSITQEGTKWLDIDVLSPYDFESLYRIKPEPKYRPYKNSIEFLTALKEHDPVLINFNNTFDYCIIPVRVWDEAFDLVSSGNIGTKYNFVDIINIYKWQDGTPCGIIED